MSIKFYAISCSSDAELSVSELFVWGELDSVRWLPQSIKEAKHRIEQCRMKNHCGFCDAEIHAMIIERRNKTTLKQSISAT